MSLRPTPRPAFTARPVPPRLLARYGGPLALVAALGALSGCGGAAEAHEHAAAVTESPRQAPVSAPATPPAPSLPRQLPGLGPRTLAQVPADAGQVVVVRGKGANSPDSSVIIYRRTGDGWHAGATWSGHNALRGWTDDHHGGDLRSPEGVFTLTDAGGLLADPGTAFPYSHGYGFAIDGTGFRGESLRGSFDYVLAINYNRKVGTSPLDWTRPLGDSKGGGIWFHVDHGGPTHGCVSLSKTHMKALLRTLEPSLHPVVVMGGPAFLAR